MQQPSDRLVHPHQQRLDQQYKEESVRYCRWCRKNPTVVGRAYCEHCFSQPRRCATRLCKEDADPYRLYCDKCYRQRNPKPEPPKSHKCRDCNVNIYDNKKVLCNHCFSGSHRCLNVLPNGEECQDYTLGGRFICLECSKKKLGVNGHKH